MKRREGARNRETKDKGRGDSDFDRICNPISRLRFAIQVYGEVVLCCENPGFFSFSSWQAYRASNAGERVDMELISQHIRQILEKNTMGCAKIEGNCFFSFLFIINYRCVFEGFA